MVMARPRMQFSMLHGISELAVAVQDILQLQSLYHLILHDVARRCNYCILLPGRASKVLRTVHMYVLVRILVQSTIHSTCTWGQG
jgi:hypothetical protein